jgi:hypothetical protein
MEYSPIHPLRNDMTVLEIHFFATMKPTNSSHSHSPVVLVIICRSSAIHWLLFAVDFERSYANGWTDASWVRHQERAEGQLGAVSLAGSLPQLAGVVARREPRSSSGASSLAASLPPQLGAASSHAASRGAARGRRRSPRGGAARGRVVARGEPRSSSGASTEIPAPSRFRLAACVGDDLRHKPRPARAASRTRPPRAVSEDSRSRELRRRSSGRRRSPPA